MRRQRGDGILSHDLMPGEKRPRTPAGVACLGPGREVAKITYFGLYFLQHPWSGVGGHRGQRRSPDDGTWAIVALMRRARCLDCPAAEFVLLHGRLGSRARARPRREIP